MDQPPIEPPDLPGPTRSHRIIAWLVIAVVAGVFAMLHQVARDQPAAGQADGKPIVERLFELQTKLVMGGLAAEEVEPDDLDRIYRQLGPFNTGSVRQRQRFAILAYELAGIDETRKLLADLHVDGDDGDGQVQDALEAVYGAGEDPTSNAPRPDRLSDDRRDLLVRELGWMGELALRPPLEAYEMERRAFLAPVASTALLVSGGLYAGLAIAVIGFFGMVIWAGLAFTGRLRSGLPTPAPDSGIYLETFAVWLLLFVGLQGVLGVAAAAIAPGSELFAGFLGFLASLAALAWPRLRGVPWRRTRIDVGLHAGRRPLAEPFLGVACYVLSLPIIIMGVLITLGLVWFVGRVTGAGGGMSPESMPAHPVVGRLGSGELWPVVQLYLAACVGAPIVEEIAFRGLLYRHLRDASRGLGTGLSIAVAVVVNGVLFAVIHPQGVMAIPALAAIAIGLALAREWRGTLIPCMVMHAINNGIVMTVIVLITRA